MGVFAQRATASRAFRLLWLFRYEQTDPARFYGAVARDTADLVADWYFDATGADLTGAVVADIGGGPGYFGECFDERGALYVPIEPDPSEMHAASITLSTSLRGSGMAIPLRDNSVEVCLSSNVAEHVSDPWRMADEMLRVTKPGGVVLLSYTVWLGPFGGHEMGLTHYLGGERAARRYTRKHGRPPKNRYGTSLFEVSVTDGLRWARSCDAELIAAFPRYHPRWAWWLVKVPLVREFLVSNLVLVLRKQSTNIVDGEALS